MRVSKDKQAGFINGMQVMRQYNFPYLSKAQSLISFQVENEIQFITLYENGVLPIYRVDMLGLSAPIEQYFKIEFP